MHNQNILVIMGSVREHRLCPQIANWIAKIGRESITAQFEEVDLKDWPLPMTDEPGIPALGGYLYEHTQSWSRKIAAAHGFVFVTPQYNWGYPAPLKNALDHLFKEWSGKPAMIVTYGGHAGDKCSNQLHQILKALEMRVTKARPGLKLSRDQIKANTGSIDPAVQFAAHEPRLRQAFTQFHRQLKGAKTGVWWWPW